MNEHASIVKTVVDKVHVLVNCPLYEEIRLTLLDQARVNIFNFDNPNDCDNANSLGKSHLS